VNPSAVISLIGVSLVVFVLQWAASPMVETYFALWPLQPINGVIHFRFWQLFTYAFLHDTGDVAHLLFNMLILWMVGSEIESDVGPRRLLGLYFASIVAAAFTQLIAATLLSTEPTFGVGASGGVFGLLLAFIVIFPKRKVRPLLPPIQMPAWVFVLLYAGVESLIGITGPVSGPAHFAPLGGMIGSLLVLLQWRRSRSRA
jgi:membrane associated rhomboid family serine protease